MCYFAFEPFYEHLSEPVMRNTFGQTYFVSEGIRTTMSDSETGDLMI